MRIYYLYFLSIFSLILPVQVSALTIEPTAYRVILEPNSVEEFIFSIENTTEQSRIFDLRVADGFNVVSTTPIQQWFQIPESITLAPNTLENIIITATTPLGALPGDKYVYLMVQERAQENAAAIAPEVGVPITITIAGEIQEHVTIQSMPLVADKGAIKTNIILDNTGMVEVPIAGTLQIFNNSGVAIAETVFQTSIRSGDTLTKEASTIISPWYIGAITATFVGTYGLYSEQITMTGRIWYVSPLLQFGIIICVLLIVILLYIYKRKRSSYV